MKIGRLCPVKQHDVALLHKFVISTCAITRQKQDVTIQQNSDKMVSTKIGTHMDTHNSRISPPMQSSYLLQNAELWFEVDWLEKMGRRELQKLCKKFGIRAISKTPRLIQDLKEFHASHLVPKSSILHFPFIPFIPICKPYEHQLTRMYSSHPAPLSSTHTTKEFRKLCKTTGSRSSSSSRTTAVSFSSQTKLNILPSYRPGDRNTKIPSVTEILNSSKPLVLIMKWRDKKLKELGEEGFKQYQSDIRKKGIAFHSFLNSFFSSESHEVCPEMSNVEDTVQSVSGVLKDISSVIATEKRVSHYCLGYSGYLDTLALYKGIPCIIEWKTSQKPKPSLQDCYEYPLQVVAYAGAVNSSPQFTVPITNCAIVVAYHDGSPADVHRMDLQSCDYYWQQWLVKLFNYKKKNTDAADTVGLVL